MALADADELAAGERMEGVGHADKLRRSDGMVCFRRRVTSGLSAGGFAWPPIRAGTMRVTGAQLAMLIEGLSEWSRVVPKVTKRPTKVP